MRFSQFIKTHPLFSSIVGIIFLWAMIYLPSLSFPDVSRNECRRILPAITMLDTGNYFTPMLAGKPYYRKPPMMNWIIATSYAMTGKSDTLTARLPTTLIVLCFAILLLFIPSGILDDKSRFISSGVFLTTVGIITHGRSADIDPNYVCCTGAAVLLWINIWSKDITGWKKWILPVVPLALGMLLKGPLILLIYYISICSILYCERKKKELFSVWHIIAVCLTLLPFCIWSFYAKHGVLPESGVVEAEMGKVWYHEIMQRFNFNDIRFGKWIGHVIGGIAQFSPWSLAILLFWYKPIRQKLNTKQLLFFKSSLMAIIILFILINAMPLTKARYSLPLLPLIAVAVGLLISKISINVNLLKIINKLLLPLFILISVLSCLLFIVFIFSRTVHLSKWVEDGKLYKVVITASSIPLCLMGISLLLNFLGLSVYLKKRHKIKSISTVFATLVFAVGISLNTFFVYIFPLTLTFRHYALNTANLINDFPPLDAIVCGVGFVGEEPFVAHINRKWIMIDNLFCLNDSLRIFIIKEGQLPALKNYKKKIAMHEAFRKKISYKHHKYLLIRLKKNDI